MSASRGNTGFQRGGDPHTHAHQFSLFMKHAGPHKWEGPDPQDFPPPLDLPLPFRACGVISLHSYPDFDLCFINIIPLSDNSEISPWFAAVCYSVVNI